MSSPKCDAVALPPADGRPRQRTQPCSTREGQGGSTHQSFPKQHGTCLIKQVNQCASQGAVRGHRHPPRRRRGGGLPYNGPRHDGVLPQVRRRLLPGHGRPRQLRQRPVRSLPCHPASVFTPQELLIRDPASPNRQIMYFKMACLHWRLLYPFSCFNVHMGVPAALGAMLCHASMWVFLPVVSDVSTEGGCAS